MRHLLLITLLATTALTACSTKPEGELTGTVGSLYNDGMDALQAKRYDTAIHTFEELDRQFPYSGWATKAQLMTAYAQMEKGDFDEMLVTVDRFIRLHPGHKDLAYAYYLRGLGHYNRISDVNRDQGHTADALAAFNEVLNRFPNSEYARDAKLKVTLCRDHLAGKEMTVGRYYQQQTQYLSAINRFKNVLTDYQTTSQAPEALYRLTESYLALGVNDEATKVAAVLGYNYPGSPWYGKAYSLLTEKQLAPAGQEKSWAQQLKKGMKDLF